MTFAKNVIFYIHLFLVFTTFSFYPQSTSTKQGGLSFRVDDNGLISQYRDYANLFNKYGNKFNFALNLSNNEFETVGYADSIRKFQDEGHQMMDHTPSHATNYFYTNFDTTDYSGVGGVDHIIGNKICLSHSTIDTNDYIHKGQASINSNYIVLSSSDYNKISKFNERYFYFPAIDKLLLVYNYKESNKHAYFHDLWAETLNISPQTSIQYYTFTRDQITLTTEGFSLLVTESLKMCAPSKLNLIPPKIWIQPGGNFPIFNSTQIKTQLESLGFTGAATYYNSAHKVYNEYNPNNDRQFAFQWGDFVEDEMNLQKIKNIIADGIAKHSVMINTIHWYSSIDDDNDWQNYLLKMEALLEWTDSNSIIIDTYDNWIDKLYTDEPNPYENIIPPLNIDLDENGIPDGFTNILYPNNSLTGTVSTDFSAPDSIAYFSDTHGTITHILNMGGIEKDTNDFCIWTKGAPNNEVKVVFSEPWPSTNSTVFVFPADTPEWRKYDLSQSTNSKKTLVTPETQSLISIDFYHQGSSTDIIGVSGMYLAKKKNISHIDFALLNDKPARAGDSLFIEVTLKDEFGNPAITSYEYNLTFPDTSSAELLTQGTLWFNNSSKDTIVIRDTTTGLSSFSSSIAHLPNIMGQLNLNISPALPSKLIILSDINPLILGGQKLLQIALEDSFTNRIPDTLVTFQALNGNGKFSNNTKIISDSTNSLGIAEVLYTASTSLVNGFDSILVSYNTSLIDTIILPLLEAPIHKLVLNPISIMPANDKDIILVEITAKDMFDNFVVNSENYLIRVAGSNSLKLLASNDFTFNNNPIDTLFLSDSLAGNFDLIVKLESDTLIADTFSISVEYSEKMVELKIFLEGPYNQIENKMDTTIIQNIPLISPYIEAQDTITSIPNTTVDWVLVSLRKDVDPLFPNPETATNVISKSALLTKTGTILDPHTLQYLTFKVPEDWYYIVLKHRNHLPIMSSSSIYLTN